jgi:hypothetical protein
VALSHVGNESSHNSILIRETYPGTGRPLSKPYNAAEPCEVILHKGNIAEDHSTDIDMDKFARGTLRIGCLSLYLVLRCSSNYHSGKPPSTPYRGF